MENLRYVYKHFRFIVYPALTGGNIYSGRHGIGYHYQRGQTKWTPLERGGYTFCYIYDDLGALRAIGLASCSPRDNFNYRIGRAIARGRAEKQL